jgi:hypothetical protein
MKRNTFEASGQSPSQSDVSAGRCAPALPDHSRNKVAVELCCEGVRTSKYYVRCIIQMNFNDDRSQFIRTTNIRSEEDKYVDVGNLKPRSAEGCKQLRSDYQEICKKASKVTDIKKFYNSGMYAYFSEKIPTITSITEVTAMMEEISELRTLIKLKDELGPGQTIQVEEYLITCIQKRVKFKYQCLSEQQRDKGHDAEILRHVFHHKRLRELTNLFFKVLKRYGDIKIAKQIKRNRQNGIRSIQDEERRRQDEERRRQDEERRRQDEERRRQDEERRRQDEERRRQDEERRKEDEQEALLDAQLIEQVQLDTESPDGPWTRHTSLKMKSDRKEKHYYMVGPT